MVLAEEVDSTADKVGFGKAPELSVFCFPLK